MQIPTHLISRSPLALATLLFASCARTTETPPTAVAASAAHASHARVSNGTLTADQLKAIADVRNATTKFHDFAYATSADGGGYTVQYPAGCAASPTGAQGVHYLNPSLVDGTVDLLRPELVMYEPGPNGQMNFVGVDYVVPLDQATSAPSLLGVNFMSLGAPLNVWALHIWAWRPNPSGMFAQWNPKVSCAEYTP
jgi:hypothetical protein